MVAHTCIEGHCKLNVKWSAGGYIHLLAVARNGQDTQVGRGHDARTPEGVPLAVGQAYLFLNGLFQHLHESLLHLL